MEYEWNITSKLVIFALEYWGYIYILKNLKKVVPSKSDGDHGQTEN